MWERALDQGPRDEKTSLRLEEPLSWLLTGGREVATLPCWPPGDQQPVLWAESEP